MTLLLTFSASRSTISRSIISRFTNARPDSPPSGLSTACGSRAAPDLVMPGASANATSSSSSSPPSLESYEPVYEPLRDAQRPPSRDARSTGSHSLVRCKSSNSPSGGPSQPTRPSGSTLPSPSRCVYFSFLRPRKQQQRMSSSKMMAPMIKNVKSNLLPSVLEKKSRGCCAACPAAPPPVAVNFASHGVAWTKPLPSRATKKIQYGTDACMPSIMKMVAVLAAGTALEPPFTVWCPEPDVPTVPGWPATTWPEVTTGLVVTPNASMMTQKPSAGSLRTTSSSAVPSSSGRITGGTTKNGADWSVVVVMFSSTGPNVFVVAAKSSAIQKMW
mmetsp:Transcript_56135/g.155414  ORF Transcript_56135/g.155414 Transcript_56135/m.155414 type:complete len:331 (+) Transcript_56135:616-1608(+)